MKKLIFTILLCALTTVHALADTRIDTKYTWKESGKKSNKVTFGGIRLGYSGLVTDLSNLELPAEAEYLKLSGKSINFDITLLGYQPRITKHFSLGTALELEVNNFRFENNMKPVRDPESGQTVPEWYTDRGILLEKSKLVTTYLNVPLVARAHFGYRERFTLYGGVIGGLRIVSHTKIKADHPELDGKFKNHGSLNLRNFHGGYLAGFSYCGFGVYAKYYPQSIFTDQGPNVRQVNVGLAFGF